MPSPFPGMDPYLEGELWTAVHSQLAAEIARQLAPKIAPRYVARTEKRFVITAPDDLDEAEISIYTDVGVRTVKARQKAKGTAARAAVEAPLVVATLMEEKAPHYCVEIRDAKRRTLVTAIELLSPFDQRGRGRTDYLRKRDALLGSPAHLIEIDFLRKGERLPMRRKLPEAEYFVFLSRAGQGPITGVWPVRLQDPLPEVPVPLTNGDPDSLLDLQKALENVYDFLRYDLDIDYRRPPDVPFTKSQAARAAAYLRRAKT
ncbi:MAG TPA: DUF4058 family protein [Pirellulales bacterium]|nr:DUF4058 family protein [Pirellulales bacterium]